MFTSISGRSVLVTGGTKGIGKGLAAGFAAAGARVVITGRDAGLGEQTAAELDRRGRRSRALPGRRCQRPGELRGRGGRRAASGTAASTCCAATPASSRPRRWTR